MVAMVTAIVRNPIYSPSLSLPKKISNLILQYMSASFYT